VTSFTRLLLPCVLLMQVTATGAPRDDSKLVLLRVSDTDISLKPTAGPNNIGNCLVVYADGRLRLELWRQEFLTGNLRNGSYRSYEGMLLKRDLAYLDSILDSDDIRKLPEFHAPKLPLRSSHFGAFTAEIDRQGVVQRVGFPNWEGEPKPSEAERADWDRQQTALQPLVDWSREIKTSGPVGWRIVRNRQGECGR
jgi:hypothetical protein